MEMTVSLMILVTMMMSDLREVWSELFSNKAAGPQCYSPSRVTTTAHTDRSVVCALLCQQRNCGVFNSDGGVCELLPAVGTPLPSSVVIYGQFSSNPKAALTNVALGKSATGTPPFDYKDKFGPMTVIDGDLDTFYHSVTNFTEVQPWLLIDLGAVHLLEMVLIMPFASKLHHAQRFVDVQVLLGTEAATDGDFSQYTVAGTYPGPVPFTGNGEWVDFPVSPAMAARYVAVYKYIVHTDSYNHLLEVVEIEAMACV